MLVTGRGSVLRAHQVEAVDAAVCALGNVPSRGVGLRATIVSACGTGKTLLGAHTALRVARSGRVLVPTLDLLVQTVAAWRGAGRAGVPHSGRGRTVVVRRGKAPRPSGSNLSGTDRGHRRDVEASLGASTAAAGLAGHRARPYPVPVRLRYTPHLGFRPAAGVTWKDPQVVSPCGDL
ncbi:DEAD/DEAH box helicase family protein [Streptomyces sp. NPDC059687]|uniref:DEAD/DEAH box helicase family protein n=1 Tax=Streptomyces sp. NPDC059687 TaxID=3346905 RepID=UPI003681AB66